MKKLFDTIGLNAMAERELIGLALKYELTTGSQINWRQDKQSLFNMIVHSITSDDPELSTRAMALINDLPAEICRKIKEIIPATPEKQETNRKNQHIYRGVVFDGNYQHLTTRHSNPPKNEKVWRGIRSR